MHDSTADITLETEAKNERIIILKCTNSKYCKCMGRELDLFLDILLIPAFCLFLIYSWSVANGPSSGLNAGGGKGTCNLIQIFNKGYS